ncbi:MAG: hypothetical protein HQK83_12710 [Fibrobacteria bacterium]|nr:hypothetical protein [Fibrobacteria bacterium]
MGARYIFSKQPIRFIWFVLAFVVLSVSFVEAAKTADDYYHDASAMYIESRMQQAMIEVEEALRHYPDDSKLSTLHEQLKKLKDQQEEQQKDKQGQKGEEGEEGEEDKKDKEDKKDEQDQEQQDKEEQAGKEDENPPEDEQDSSGTAAEETDEPPPEGEMSEEEAERLLDAYKDDEKKDLEQTRTRKGRRTTIDW